MVASALSTYLDGTQAGQQEPDAHLDVSKLARVLAAIYAGHETTDELQRATGMELSDVLAVVGELVRRRMIERAPGSDERYVLGEETRRVLQNSLASS